MLPTCIAFEDLRIIHNSDISAALANCEMTTTQAILCDRNVIYIISACESLLDLGHGFFNKYCLSRCN